MLRALLKLLHWFWQRENCSLMFVKKKTKAKTSPPAPLPEGYQVLQKNSGLSSGEKAILKKYMKESRKKQQDVYEYNKKTQPPLLDCCILFVHMFCLHVCVCTTCVPGIVEVSKEVASAPLELELADDCDSYVDAGDQTQLIFYESNKCL